MSTIFPVILSGGSGTRLWPLSRSMYPKQFIHFFNGQTTSFLGAALKRLKSGPDFAGPILLCNNDHRFLVREELERAGIEAEKIILEPVARNTAPAIAVAALVALQSDPAAILAVMPSDHIVKDEAVFAESVRRAAKVASEGRLVLFGIKPNEPVTGYGYIKRGARLPGEETEAFIVDAFAEKPDRATAESYLAQGTYYWNSGIFVLDARTYIDEIERLAPEILTAARDALANAVEDLGFLRLEKKSFAAAPSISVDYAVMEKTAAASMLPLDVGWNDVGSWSSLWDVAERDADGNYVKGDAILQDTTDCYVHSEKSVVATIGVRDLIVVDTPDALLIADKNRSQDVGKIVGRLKQSNRKEQEQHLRNYRPWGYFETLNIGPRFQVKLLHVKPGGMLSMQMHHHRSEHWVVVQGTARVVIGEREQLVRENQSVYIVATQWHRLENPGKVPVQIIEVQIGSYLGEDDILRTDDIYHRTPEETK
ncbi:mannose-1-phosphate guanylyltransferase/mannose-6-phosphate isomerase [Hyphomicrobium methylovorum]|uniref:mannose-1-phosphate guanylyltransferase/mannose-6-phosphate isomerase n=1 Tax=Hyphomicrobium methylovorum TaxID=84 RepID=UPI0015E7625F|nr:mannose-1-phosphate guanylyltransferase/mannose-6-phosphate isomerase [Hyphomicrobium methylovorum]MBA2126593.1 mannose-1-phosphate guanylyltransferase/mannose-6-phosphate isomerase [Hyphomicrobium methylovorum]